MRDTAWMGVYVEIVCVEVFVEGRNYVIRDLIMERLSDGAAT